MKIQLRTQLLLPVAALTLAACASPTPAPVVNGTASSDYGYGSDVYTPNNPTSGSYTPPSDTNPYTGAPYNPPAGEQSVVHTPANQPYQNPYDTTSPYPNPYGATSPNTPYQNPYNTANHTYTPPPAPKASGYAGNYSAVDPSASYHIVEAGDTVYNIAKRYGISEDTLRHLNSLPDNNIQRGQRLRVKAAANNTSANASGSLTHRVEAGDTVYSIAKRYGISEESLRRINNLPDNNIQSGQILRIPSAQAASGSTAAPKGTHRVEAGDTVYNIAKRYGISEDSLRAQNRLSDNTIQVGQILTVHASGKPAVAGTAPADRPAAINKPAPAATPSPSASVSANNIHPPAKTPTPTSSITRNKEGVTWQSPSPGGRLTSIIPTNKVVEIKGGELAQSSADGKVLYAGIPKEEIYRKTYGNLVVVEHANGMMTAYGNLKDIKVKQGQNVRRGQMLSHLTDNTLIFNVRKGGDPVNAEEYIPF